MTYTKCFKGEIPGLGTLAWEMEEKPLVWRGKEWILETGFEEEAEKKCLCEEWANGIAK